MGFILLDHLINVEDQPKCLYKLDLSFNLGP